MAKKAKRRGRPPGSKNKKKSVGKLTRNFAKMEVSQLRDYITNLERPGIEDPAAAQILERRPGADLRVQHVASPSAA